MITNIKKILLPTDFSDTADAALAYAAELAADLGATVDLVHVFSDPYALSLSVPEVYRPVPADTRERVLADLRAHLRARIGTLGAHGVTGTNTIVTGLVAPTIVTYAADHAIDLIVIGTHGRRGVAHLLLGSVAEHVVRTATCPVLTVRQPAAAVKAGDRAPQVGAVQPATPAIGSTPS